MTLPTLFHPNMFRNFNNQNNISTSFFNAMLDTIKTREEIGRSWDAKYRHIEIANAQFRERLARIKYN